jgi:hypothetical protein
MKTSLKNVLRLQHCERMLKKEFHHFKINFHFESWEALEQGLKIKPHSN